MPDAASPYVGKAQVDRDRLAKDNELDAREERVRAIMRVPQRAALRDRGPEVDSVY